MRITTKIGALCLLLVELAMALEQESAALADNSAYAGLWNSAVSSATPPLVSAPPEVQYSLPTQPTTTPTPLLTPAQTCVPATGQVIPASYQVNCGSSVCGGSGEYCEPFWYFSGEILSLQANLASPLFALSDNSPSTGGRLQLGYEWESGFGMRSRWGGTGLDTTLNYYDSGPSTVQFELNTGQFDFDFYRRYLAGNGSFLFGAGISAAALNLGLSDAMEEDFFELKNAGAGISVFAEGRHCFYRSPIESWSMLARGRWAYMISRSENSLSTLEEFDSTLDVAEAGVGLECRHRFTSWSLVTQGMFEAQSWGLSNFHEVNFFGSACRIGCEW